MSDYLTVTEMALLTSLHRQTVYTKVRRAYDSGSDLVTFDKDLGYRVSKKLFQKYIVEKNSEEVEAIAPDVIQLSERVYEDLIKERDVLKKEVKALYERVLNSERLYYEALYSDTKRLEEEKQTPELIPASTNREENIIYNPIESPLSEPIGANNESIYGNKESGLEGVKTPNKAKFNEPSTIEILYVVVPAIVVIASVVFYFLVIA